MATPTTSTKVLTPEAMLSYPKLATPEPGPSGGEPKYGCALVFSPEAQQTPEYKAMKAAVLQAGKEFFKEKFEEWFRAGKIRSPLRDDAADKGYPAGSVFINCRSKQKPGIVDRQAKNMANDDERLYPGAKVRASVTAFGYDVSGNKGVSFAINNMQWLADGERLDSRRPASEEFAPLDEAPPADLDGLL